MRRVELQTAVAPRRVEHVARQTARVHTHHHVLPVADLPLDERHVGLAVDHALEGDDPEIPMLGWQCRRRDAMNQRLGSHPVLDEIRDRDHQQLVLLRELRQLRHARHRAVVVHDFADDAGRIQTGDAREIDGRLRLSSADEHAASAGLEREHVAGPREVRRARVGVDRHQHRRGAIAGRNAGARDALRLDRHAERGVEAGGILAHHLRRCRARRAAPRSSACRSGRGRASP